jgi:hypothetical protein
MTPSNKLQLKGECGIGNSQLIPVFGAVKSVEEVRR